MGLFNFLFGDSHKPRHFSEPAKEEPEVATERDWVGRIVGLIMYSLENNGMGGIDKWTILIEDDNELGLLSGPPASGEKRRNCILGDCKSLENVKKFYQMVGPAAAEPAIQDLAFEICRRAEPRWAELIKKQP